MDTIVFDGHTYEEVSGDYTETNTLICKSKDGTYSIYKTKEDDDYVVLRSFTDNYLYKKVN